MSIFILGSIWLTILANPSYDTSFEDGLVGVLFSLFLLIGAALSVLVGVHHVLPSKTTQNNDAKSASGSFHGAGVAQETRNDTNRTTNYPLNYSALERPLLSVFTKTYRSSPTLYRQFALVSIVVSGVFIILLSAVYSLTSYDKYYLIALPLVVFMGLAITTLIDLRSSRIGEFAKDNEFTYKASGQIKLMSGTIFAGYGKSASISSLVEGKLANGQLFSLLSYSFDAAPRDKKIKDIFKIRVSKTDTYRVSTIRFEVNKKLPHIILDSRENDLFGYSKLPLIHKRSSFDRLELEGHFNDYYTLFYTVSGNKKINKPAYVLSLLSPDLMEWLINSNIKYDIELVGNKIFIHAPFKSIQEYEVVNGLFSAANMLASRMEQALKDFNDTE